MSIIEEYSFTTEQFVSSYEDLLLSTTPKETFLEIDNYIQTYGYERQIHELNYKLVQKDILIHSLSKKNTELEQKYKDYELAYLVWKDLIG